MENDIKKNIRNNWNNCRYNIYILRNLYIIYLLFLYFYINLIYTLAALVCFLNQKINYKYKDYNKWVFILNKKIWHFVLNNICRYTVFNGSWKGKKVININKNRNGIRHLTRYKWRKYLSNLSFIKLYLLKERLSKKIAFRDFLRITCNFRLPWFSRDYSATDIPISFHRFILHRCCRRALLLLELPAGATLQVEDNLLVVKKEGERKRELRRARKNVIRRGGGRATVLPGQIYVANICKTSRFRP